MSSRTEQEIKILENHIDQLIATCRRLQSENNTLRSAHAALTRERCELQHKNELAKSHIENMITRLKSMEDRS